MGGGGGGGGEGLDPSHVDLLHACTCINKVPPPVCAHERTANSLPCIIVAARQCHNTFLIFFSRY